MAGSNRIVGPNRNFTTATGIRYTLKSGPVYDFDTLGRQTAKAEYIIPSVKMQQFIAEVTPSPTIDESGYVRLKAFKTILIPPHLRPEHITIEPFNDERPFDPYQYDTSAPGGTYEGFAKVTIDYATNVHALHSGKTYTDDRTSEKPETILESNFSVTVEMLSVNGNGGLRVGGTAGSTSLSGATQPLGLSMPTVKVIPIVQHSKKWSWAYRPNFEKIYSLLGCVNDNAYKFLDDSARETVLFLGLSGKQKFAHQEAKALIELWDFDYIFAQRQINEDGKVYGWNHVYNPDTNAFEPVKRTTATAAATGTGKPLYALANLLDLFKGVPLPRSP